MTTQSLTSNPTQATIETWLIDWTAENLDLETTEIDINQSFLSYDMNSVTAMMLVGDLEDWLSLSLSPTLVWDYPDIKTLAEYLAQESNKNETQNRTETDTNVEQLLDNIDNLSEADMDNLLNSLLSK
ncbi:MAG: acyl carrier protein [Crocosphaera sp.]|nr:acyl carrier protein [Crocosphaera sp.]